jgi:hypothetical protein
VTVQGSSRVRIEVSELRPAVARRSKIAAPDSIDSKRAGDKNFFGQVILTLALGASREFPARRGVWLG